MLARNLLLGFNKERQTDSFFFKGNTMRTYSQSSPSTNFDNQIVSNMMTPSTTTSTSYLSLPTFGSLTRTSTEPGDKAVEVSMQKLTSLLKPLIDSIFVDEKWYTETYKDVQEAIYAGKILNAKEHFVGSGYFENRMPHKIVVDEIWYLNEYTDVKDAISRGRFASAQDHFFMNGFAEGRQPSKGWSLIA
jgi:hypothetical protein